MRYIIIHRVLYLVLCVTSLVTMDWPLAWVKGTSHSMDWLLGWHASIIVVVTLSMFNILRKTATDRTYYYEVLFSKVRMTVAIFMGIMCGFFLLSKYMGFSEVGHPPLPEIVLAILVGIIFIIGLSPLSGFIWMPLLDILDKPWLTYLFYKGFFITVFLCLVFIFGEWMFLKQLKTIKHLFLLPAKEEENG